MKAIIRGSCTRFDSSEPFELFKIVESHMDYYKGGSDWFLLANGKAVFSRYDGSYYDKQDNVYQELWLQEVADDGSLGELIETLGFIRCGR